MHNRGECMLVLLSLLLGLLVVGPVVQLGFCWSRSYAVLVKLVCCGALSPSAMLRVTLVAFVILLLPDINISMLCLWVQI